MEGATAIHGQCNTFPAGRGVLMAEVVHIEGWDELLDDLETFPDTVAPLVARRMARALLILEGTLREYPPATEGNRPRTYTPGGQNMWYERGYGPRWVRKNNSVRGLKTSRNLGKQWAQEVNVYPGGNGEVSGPLVEGVLGNSASYADLVQGSRQLPVHKRHGWVTVEEALARHRQDIVEELLGAVDDAAQALRNGD